MIRGKIKIVLIGCFIVAAVGVLLFVKGTRGHRVDTHPLCRLCGYDLTGRLDHALPCSECGADLSRKNAVRNGHRKRQPWAINLGLASAMLPLLLLGMILVGKATHVNWIQHAPLWYVLREANADDAANRTPAITELSRRCTSDLVSPAELNRILDAGLHYQQNSSKPWDTSWGDLIEGMNNVGRLSQERWSLYARQSFPQSPEFVVVPESSQIFRRYWEVTVPAFRLAGPSKLSTSVSFTFEPEDVSYDDSRRRIEGHRSAGHFGGFPTLQGSECSPYSMSGFVELASKTLPGTHLLRGKLELTLSDEYSKWTSPPSAGAAEGLIQARLERLGANIA